MLPISLTLIAASLPTLIQAQYIPDFGNGNGNGPGSFSGNNGPNFDVDTALRVRAVHGILGCLAFAILFPSGAVLIRFLPGRIALWCHALSQIAAFCVYVAAAGLGFWMVNEIQVPFQEGNLLENGQINYHPIIGIVVLVSLLLQPALGLAHHAKFKRLGRRTAWSHMHLWNGRASTLLGIVNGGLGLKVASEARRYKVAYAAVAGVFGGIWLLIAVMSEFRRWRAGTKVGRRGTVGGENGPGMKL